MTAEELDKLVDKRVKHIIETLKSKANEYASGSDRLHNFKRSAAFTRETPQEVCCGFLVKHLTSLFDMVDKITPTTRASLNEKIGDAINYLILLEALFIE